MLSSIKLVATPHPQMKNPPPWRIFLDVIRTVCTYLWCSRESRLSYDCRPATGGCTSLHAARPRWARKSTEIWLNSVPSGQKSTQIGTVPETPTTGMGNDHTVDTKVDTKRDKFHSLVFCFSPEMSIRKIFWWQGWDGGEGAEAIRVIEPVAGRAAGRTLCANIPTSRWTTARRRA